MIAQIGTSNPNDEMIFKHLEVVNSLIKNGLLSDAETALSKCNFDDLSVGLQLYYRYLQSRLFLADFMLNGQMSDLYSADECATDIVIISKQAGCRLKNYNYLVVRCLCKMQLALNANQAVSAEARSYAEYLIGLGTSKFPEKGIFTWMKNQLENTPREGEADLLSNNHLK